MHSPRVSSVFHYYFPKPDLVVVSHGKGGANLFEQDLAGVSGRHRLGCVSHLLAENGGTESGEFPSAIAVVTKGVHSSLWKPGGFECWVQTIVQHTGLAQS